MALNYTSPATLASTSFSSLASKNTTATAAAGCIARATGTSSNVVDTQVRVTVVTPAFTATASTSVDLYVVGSNDGTTWPDGVTASDAAITLPSLSNNLRWIGSLMCPTSAGTFVSEPLSVAAAFGGVMPQQWKVVIQNNLPAGVSLTSGTVSFSEIYYN